MKKIIALSLLVAFTGCANMTPEQREAMRAMGGELQRQGSTSTGIFTPRQVAVQPTVTYITPAPVSAPQATGRSGALVSQTKMPNGKTVCTYGDGTTIVTSFNNCPSHK